MHSINLVVELFKARVFPQVSDNVAPGMGDDKTHRFVACLQVVEDRLGEDFKSCAIGGGDLEGLRGLNDLDV
mgnify:CR=1 FL=1